MLVSILNSYTAKTGVASCCLLTTSKNSAERRPRAGQFGTIMDLTTSPSFPPNWNHSTGVSSSSDSIVEIERTVKRRYAS